MPERVKFDDMLASLHRSLEPSLTIAGRQHPV